MNRLLEATAVAVILLGAGPIFAVDEPLHMRGAQVVGGPVTPVVVNIDIRDLPAVSQWQPGDPVKEIPRRFFPPKDGAPGFYEANPDPLVDLQSATPLRSADAFTTPIVNRSGQGYSGVSPPDTVGDIGPNHYIQAINHGNGTAIQIYDKTGATVGSPFYLDSLGSGSCANGYGDPIVLYDRLADRWFLQEFSSSGNYMCIYISQTADPVTGGWYAYSFQPPSFPDYPHFGVWPDAYYGTANENRAVYAFDRTNMLAGATARAMQRFSLIDLPGYGFQCATPADLDGADAPPAGAPGLIMRHIDEEAHSTFPNNPDTDLLEIYAFTVDFDTPASSSLDQLPDVVITDFNSWLVNYTTFYSVPQPGTSQGLDPIREVVLNRLQYRNFGTYESLVGVLPTNAYTATSGSNVSAALRWFELRRSGGGDWSTFQEGTFATGDFNENRFVGSVAMDQSGNIALGHSYTNVSAATPTNPSLRYTGRLSTDPAGVMTQTETQQVTGTGTGGGRWGDYADMTVDPADDCTFWFTSEYQNGGSWATQITSFRFDACGCELVIEPPAASAGVGGPNLIQVGWNDSATPEMTEYRVFRSFIAGGPYELIATVPDSSPGSGGGVGYTFNDFDVSGGTEYFYVVRSSDGSACTSDPSNEVSAVATGDCTLPPLFGGLEMVVNPAGSLCALELGWNEGTSRCGGGLTYNVYRSTEQGFTPAPGNRVATGVAGTGYVDGGPLQSLVRHYYVVRAVDSVNGAEEENTIEDSGVPTGPFTIGTWTDDAGDTGDATLAAESPWSVAATGGNIGPHVYLTGTYGNNVCASVTTPSMMLGTGSTLNFWSKYQIENSWDKGVVEISSNGGSTWAKVPVNYPGSSTNTSDSCGLPNGTYFTGSGTPTWAQYTASLAAWDGLEVMLRWRLSTDGSVTYQGWWVDDISITNVMVPSDCDSGEPPLFADGFESNDTSAWSSSTP